MTMKPTISQEELLERIDSALDAIATAIVEGEEQQNTIALSKRLISHACTLESAVCLEDETVAWIEGETRADIERALS